MSETFKLPLEKFQGIRTPFYYYDTQLLQRTLDTIKEQTEPHPEYHVHYAVKACAHPAILKQIQQAGLGADCVSGGEIQACLDAGFSAAHIVYAGVGKSDWEIELGLKNDIGYFNVESEAELDVIQEIANRMNKVANVSFRINPNVGAHTHANITTGLAENKFGIAMDRMEDIIQKANLMPNINFTGLHFHIGSQILVMNDFIELAHRINELQDRLEEQHIGPLKHINVGGGLGVDYIDPDKHPIPQFEDYFNTYAKHLKLRSGQQLHFELGRAVVAQCGTLVTRCLYVKETTHKKFIIVDAGMTDLIRPALYNATHRIQNLSNTKEETTMHYDVVGPICESSDVFAQNYALPTTRRGDWIALRTAGAYGQIMASQYNCRTLPKGYLDCDFN